MKNSKLTRRAFLETAAATIATQMKFTGAQNAAKTHTDAEEAAAMGCLFCCRGVSLLTYALRDAPWLCGAPERPAW